MNNRCSSRILLHQVGLTAPFFAASRDGATGFPVKVTHASQFLSSKRQTVNAKLLRDMDL